MRFVREHRVGLSAVIAGWAIAALLACTCYGGEEHTSPGVLGSAVNGIVHPIEQELLAETNKARAANGCRPLEMDNTLLVDCRRHAIWMCSHGMRHGSLPHCSAENIAWNQRTAADVVRTWLNSPGHRRNMLNPHFTKLGVAGYDAGRGVYWVQQFK